MGLLVIFNRMDSSSSNDTRGWLMSVISGIACVLGASLIFVDIIVRKIPNTRCRNFRIQDSEAFLAVCFSVSFGVMIFSALIDLFPSSINYFINAGWTRKAPMGAALGCAAGGFLAIQIFQRIAHSYMPSHVVDCDHTHDTSHPHGHTHSRPDSHAPKTRVMDDEIASESTPLVNGNSTSATKTLTRSISDTPIHNEGLEGHEEHEGHEVLEGYVRVSRRPSLKQMPSRILSFVKDTKSNCDEDGSCFGYSDPCGQECFKHIGPNMFTSSRQSALPWSSTGRIPHTAIPAVQEEATNGMDESTDTEPSAHISRAFPCITDVQAYDNHEDDLEAQHHHHVPKNAFLNLGLQTSLAIGLHKLPEGFITYATNHANPKLGIAVFSALLVHNITEGFALALPLYLALQSRPRAMFWSSIAGGLSQPTGAAIAWLWFKLAGSAEHAPGYVAYGVMFATTAGVMTSVAFMLFIEGLAMNHNQNLCTFAALFGMGIMGVSSLLKE